MKRVAGSIVLVLASVTFSAAAVNIDVNTPNASVRVGSPQPVRQVHVNERERGIAQEGRHGRKSDRGKHKGQNKKHTKERRVERNEHR